MVNVLIRFLMRRNSQILTNHPGVDPAFSRTALGRPKAGEGVPLYTGLDYAAQHDAGSHALQILTLLTDLNVDFGASRHIIEEGSYGVAQLFVWKHFVDTDTG